MKISEEKIKKINSALKALDVDEIKLLTIPLKTTNEQIEKDIDFIETKELTAKHKKKTPRYRLTVKYNRECYYLYSRCVIRAYIKRIDNKKYYKVDSIEMKYNNGFDSIKKKWKIKVALNSRIK